MLKDDEGCRIYWLTEAEAAGRLNVNQKELRALVDSGELNGLFKTGTGGFMIPVDEVEAYTLRMRMAAFAGAASLTH
jgi:excisionase family DNA binding protein